MEGAPRILPRARELTTHLEITSIKKERRVIVDILLRGMESPICWPDHTRREVCYLPGAQVRDTARKLPCLVCPSDNYCLLIVQAGSDEAAERSLRAI